MISFYLPQWRVPQYPEVVFYPGTSFYIGSTPVPLWAIPAFPVVTNPH